MDPAEKERIIRQVMGDHRRWKARDGLLGILSLFMLAVIVLGGLWSAREIRCWHKPEDAVCAVAESRPGVKAAIEAYLTSAVNDIIAGGPVRHRAIAELLGLMLIAAVGVVWIMLNAYGWRRDIRSIDDPPYDLYE